MRRNIIGPLILAAIIIVCALACELKTVVQNEKGDSMINTEEMNSYISIFEIPASDMSRAIIFYQTILDISIEKMEMADLEIGVLPFEGQMVTGVIMKGEGYQPSADGVTVYLNGGDDLQLILDRVESSGGAVLVPKTPHADEIGYFALFLDSEGNKMGLHSPN